MEKNEIQGLNKRLDAIIAILLNQTKVQEETLKEKILRLVTYGFENQEIANILGTTPGLVAKERSLFKKGGKK